MQNVNLKKLVLVAVAVTASSLTDGLHTKIAVRKHADADRKIASFEFVPVPLPSAFLPMNHLIPTMGPQVGEIPGITDGGSGFSGPGLGFSGLEAPSAGSPFLEAAMASAIAQATPTGFSGGYRMEDYYHPETPIVNPTVAREFLNSPIWKSAASFNASVSDQGSKVFEYGGNPAPSVEKRISSVFSTAAI